MLVLLQDKIDTPLGPLWILCDEQFRLRAVEWDEHSDRMTQLLDLHYRDEGYQRIDARNPGGLSHQLDAYFAGDLGIIETLPTATAGTPFQREVWQALRTIPCGQVMHYGQLAEALGRPGAARGRRGQRLKPGQHSRALPPCHWAKWHHDRLCRRRAAERVVIAP